MFVSEPLSCKVKAGEGMTVMKFALYIGIKCKKKNKSLANSCEEVPVLENN